MRFCIREEENADAANSFRMEKRIIYPPRRKQFSKLLMIQVSRETGSDFVAVSLAGRGDGRHL